MHNRLAGRDYEWALSKINDFVLLLVELAFCGEVFDLTFVLQYFRFIPEIEEIKFFLQVGPKVFFCFVSTFL